MTAMLRGAWPPVASILVLFALWEGLTRGLHVPEYILPAPSAIWTAVAATGPAVWRHTEATLFTVLVGFAASVLISLPIAVLIASSRALAAAIYPILVITQSVPKVALAPILIIALGATAVPRVIVTVLVAFFPLVVSSVAGLLATPPELLELARSCRATRWQELFRIRLPFAIPFVFAGLKVAIALCVVGAVVAEFVGADEGLGYLIQTSMAFFRVPLAFGAVVILAAMGMVLFGIVSAAERLFFPWAAQRSDLTP
jgi:NitT/TauT family transport system permease protein